VNLKSLDSRDFGREIEKFFRPQNPVEHASLLQGRKPQLQKIHETIAATGRSGFIWGDRGVGKTSLAVASAHENLPAAVQPVRVGCDGRSHMLNLMSAVVSDLLGKDPLSGGANYKATMTLGPLNVESSSSRQTWELENVNDAVRVLQAAVDQWRENFRGYNPIVIIDEFDQLPVEERRYFGDLIKQIGDRAVRLTLLFCGVSESFDDLLGGHESAFRYVEPIHLERLYLDDAMRILHAGATGLGVAIHDDHALRAAQISDGFPHFVHLLGSAMLWQWYNDKSASSKVESDHFEAGILRAVSSTEKKLEDLYHAATRKYTGGWDYLLWATADHHQLIEPSNNIWLSYCRIIREAEVLRQSKPELGLPEIVSPNEKRQDPYDRARFNSKMYHLKDKGHGYVLKATRAGWYQFRVPMLRGYCRLLAQRYGIRLGGEYGGISKPYTPVDPAVTSSDRDAG